MNRLVATLTLMALVGCSQGDMPPTKPVSRVAQAGQKSAAPVFGLVTAGAAAGTAYEARIREQRAFARLPDRGELLSYSSRGSSQGAIMKGAYTWHRVDVSEEHALRAIVDGRLRVMTPSGQALDIRYDRHIEHPSGDLSWIGHIEGQPGVRTILTFGADAVYGSIGQPGKRSLRLTTRNGAGWIVETDPTKLAGIAAANPSKPDFLAMPKVRRNPDAKPPTAYAPTTITAATTAATTTIDLLVGYTPGFASKGASAAMTRLNQMVTAGNEAFANSQVNAQIRLVHAMQVNYADNTSNDDTLEQLTGYDSDNDRYTTPNAAFNALRAARETYGADLVTLVRAFREPEQDGCGIAWLIGSGMTQVRADDGSDYFGYSVVSDGEDDSYYCRDETLVHELAHNIGSQHDRESAEGGDGTLDTDDYGAFSYSFGFKTSAAAGNFYTIMAYGDEGQQDYPVFSNPRVTAICGNRACGTVNEDNARSLGQLAPTIAAFRATRVNDPNSVGGVVAGNFNGDGRSDLLWRHSSNGQNSIWLSANVGTKQSVASVSDLRWIVAATGDFNRDGRSDILWRNQSNGQNSVWYSGNVNTRINLETVADLSWQVAGVADFNNDGRSDIFWRNTKNGQNSIWYSGNVNTRTNLSPLADFNWQVAGVDDFDNDGRSDILWRNISNGQNSLWYSGNVNTRLNLSPVSDLRWGVAGVGDFNNDGRSDILWRNTTNGENSIWYSGNVNTRSNLASVTDQRWLIAATGDFNGDGRDDILWRHTGSGENSIWLSGNRDTRQSVGQVADQKWQVVG
jgi:hypothetical protein